MARPAALHAGCCPRDRDTGLRQGAGMSPAGGELQGQASRQEWLCPLPFSKVGTPCVGYMSQSLPCHLFRPVSGPPGPPTPSLDQVTEGVHTGPAPGQVSSQRHKRWYWTLWLAIWVKGPVGCRGRWARSGELIAKDLEHQGCELDAATWLKRQTAVLLGVLLVETAQVS